MKKVHFCILRDPSLLLRVLIICLNRLHFSPLGLTHHLRVASIGNTSIATVERTPSASLHRVKISYSRGTSFEMPSRTLPTFSRAEVESHNTESSCYVTIGTKVYDVTDFVDDHPGGGSLIMDYAGKDIEDILKDSDSHEHSEAAYEVLDDSLVGFLVEKAGLENGTTHTNGDATLYVHPRTGMSCEEDLSRDTDPNTDYKKHKFLDLSKPLFLQIWRGGFSKEFYLDQVHRPRHYKGGESAPLFGNFLEPLTKTPWWLVPTIWLPCVGYGLYLASEGLSGGLETGAYWLFGVFLWSFIEYVMHRFLFHLDQ